MTLRSRLLIPLSAPVLAATLVGSAFAAPAVRIPLPPPRPAEASMIPQDLPGSARDAYRNDRWRNLHDWSSQSTSERQHWPNAARKGPLPPKVSSEAADQADPIEQTGTISSAAAPRMGGPGMTGPASGQHSPGGQRWDVDPGAPAHVPLPLPRP
jgi:hypothetical protein